MIRLGLCCLFLKEPIRFSTTTATSLLKMKRKEALKKLSRLCLANAQTLQRALEYCKTHHIRAFRVTSEILPVKTHPRAGYDIRDLPDAKQIIKIFKECGRFAKAHDIRLSFHPDQFVILNSPSRSVIRQSIKELAYQAQVSNWIGADVTNIHGGGGYGNKKKALDRLIKSVRKLPRNIRKRLSLENDDRVFTPRDLLPVCQKLHVPFVYDVHHHRCLPDGLSIDETTRLALQTWNREPLFHISSPIKGWSHPHRNRHHDYIDLQDFPKEWKNLHVTVDVEAKAKELAVHKFYLGLKQQGIVVDP